MDDGVPQRSSQVKNESPRDHIRRIKERRRKEKRNRKGPRAALAQTSRAYTAAISVPYGKITSSAEKSHVLTNVLTLVTFNSRSIITHNGAKLLSTHDSSS